MASNNYSHGVRHTRKGAQMDEGARRGEVRRRRGRGDHRRRADLPHAPPGDTHEEDQRQARGPTGGKRPPLASANTPAPPAIPIRPTSETARPPRFWLNSPSLRAAHF